MIGSAIMIHELLYFEGRRTADRWLALFFAAFTLAPIWFMIANFRLLAIGEPDWLLNRWISFGVRVPLLLALYLAIWKLRRRRGDTP